jgi:hypothetical protein
MTSQSEKLKALIESGLSMAKTDTEPPEYRFSLEGKEKIVRVPLSMVKNRKKVNLLTWGAWDFNALDGVTDKEWPVILDEWVQNGTVRIIDTGGVDLSSRIITAVKGWLDARGEGSEFSDMLSGCYVLRVNKGEQCYCFLPEPVLRILRDRLGHPVKAQDVEFALRRVGLRSGRDVNPIRVGKNTWQGRPWVVPVEALDRFVQPIVEETQRELETSDNEIPKDF